MCVSLSGCTDFGLSHEVTDITLLRHRRTMKQLVAMDLCQFLNGLAKELMLQAEWIY